MSNMIGIGLGTTGERLRRQDLPPVPPSSTTLTVDEVARLVARWYALGYPHDKVTGRLNALLDGWRDVLILASVDGKPRWVQRPSYMSGQGAP